MNRYAAGQRQGASSLGARPGPPGIGLSLEYPKSLGVFDQYEQAQHAVDYLSDNDFAVANLAIVGTELKSVERVTG